MALRTNEKLYHAQLLVTQALRAEGALQRALVESVVFELVLAYRGFLSEVAAALSEKLQADDARRMLVQLQQRQRESSIINELAALERGGEWPAQLLQAYVAATTLEIASKSSGVQNADPLRLVAVDNDFVEADAERCQRWLQTLQSFIDAQRAYLQEW